MNRFLRVLTFVAAMTSLVATSLAQSGTRMSVTTDRTNVRAQPSSDSEVLASLNKGQVIEVVGQVTPARSTESWSRIRMPSAVSVWVYASLVDTQKGEVKAKELNYRAGPGRNYSVLGELKKGDPIKVIRSMDGWLQIEAPSNAVAYIASRLLGPEIRETRAIAPPPSAAPSGATPPTNSSPAIIERTPPPIPASSASSQTVSPPPPLITPPNTIEATPPTEASAPTPTTEKIEEPPPVEPEPSVPPTQSTPPTRVTSNANSTTTAPFPMPPVGSPRALAAEPKRVPRPISSIAIEPRFVVREGLVERTVSLQAPTDYELRNGFYREGLINYLLLEPQKELRQYAGKRVMVSGFEYLDSRWSTPVLRVQDIQLMP